MCLFIVYNENNIKGFFSCNLEKFDLYRVLAGVLFLCLDPV